MKVIVAGSRTVTGKDWVFSAIWHSKFEITEVVSGFQRTYNDKGEIVGGADYWGEVWAKQNRIPIMQFPAEWDKYGRSAGPIRNKQMGEYADALVACWDEKSSGTRSMILIMQQLHKPYYLDIRRPGVWKQIDATKVQYNVY